MHQKSRLANLLLHFCFTFIFLSIHHFFPMADFSKAIATNTNKKSHIHHNTENVYNFHPLSHPPHHPHQMTKMHKKLTSSSPSSPATSNTNNNDHLLLFPPLTYSRLVHSYSFLVETDKITSPFWIGVVELTISLTVIFLFTGGHSGS